MPRTPRDDDRFHSSPAFVEALGRTIKVLRTDLGIDRRTLAQEAGISYSYLTEIENGNKPPSSSVLGPIASALGMLEIAKTKPSRAASHLVAKPVE